MRVVRVHDRELVSFYFIRNFECDRFSAVRVCSRRDEFADFICVDPAPTNWLLIRPTCEFHLLLHDSDCWLPLFEHEWLRRRKDFEWMIEDAYTLLDVHAFSFYNPTCCLERAEFLEVNA